MAVHSVARLTYFPSSPARPLTDSATVRGPGRITSSSLQSLNQNSLPRPGRSPPQTESGRRQANHGLRRPLPPPPSAEFNAEFGPGNRRRTETESAHEPIDAHPSTRPASSPTAITAIHDRGPAHREPAAAIAATDPATEPATITAEIAATKPVAEPAAIVALYIYIYPSPQARCHHRRHHSSALPPTPPLSSLPSLPLSLMPAPPPSRQPI